MNRLSKPLRLYAVITAIFALAATVLRSACLLLAFDAEIGYFQSKNALVTALYIMEGIFLLVALCLPLFLGQGSALSQQAHALAWLADRCRCNGDLRGGGFGLPFCKPW